jgi:hypothetical protein
MVRRNLLTLVLVAVALFLSLSFILTFRNRTAGAQSDLYSQSHIPVADSLLHGEATAHKLENATLKY